MVRTIWPRSSSARVAKAIEAHSVIALALGGLIYILAVTGTLSVFNHELQRWEQPNAPEMTTIAPEAAAMAARSVFEMEPTTTHVFITFPEPDLPRTVISTDTQAFYANLDGTVGPEESFPWTQFLLDLHYYLHLPQTLGLTVVGALGAFLIAMSISGFMAHPRIFRDAFTTRRGEGRVPLTDLHNRLSVWTAPFHISNALTGSILGLASVLAFAIASTSFSGDTNKVFSPVFGGEHSELEGDAPLANIAGPLRFMAENYPELPRTYFIMHDPATAGQHSTVIAKHPDRLIFGEYYNFDADGAFEGTVGISNGTAGQQIIGSIYNVHFGNWGGLPVKLAYLVFGLALSVIIASGMKVYFTRRREKGRPAPRLEAGWQAIVWGTPAMLGVTLAVSLTLGTSGGALVVVFWLGLCLCIALSLLVGIASRASFALIALTAAALITTILGYIVEYGMLSFTEAGISVIFVFGIAAVLLLAKLLNGAMDKNRDSLQAAE